MKATMPPPLKQLTKKLPDVPPRYLTGVVRGDQILAWCPYCRRWHVHGVGGDILHIGYITPRGAHCFSQRSPYTSYEIIVEEILEQGQPSALFSYKGGAS